MTKTCQKGCLLYVNKGSTPNGHSRKRTALITSAFTKPLFSELPYKLCIFTFPQAAASSSYGHLFRVPRMSTYESFHCIAVSCLQLRATRGARNPNVQVVTTHASPVCCQYSFGLLLKMNGMQRTQLDHARLDLPSYVI